MNHHVLLTVSGVIPSDLAPEVAAGDRPRADYVELARTFQADLLDYAAARRQLGPLGKLIERIGGAELMLAYACFSLRKRYRAIVTDGEQIGLPLAALLKLFSPRRRPRHLMITHIISVPKKQVFLDVLRVQQCIDRFLVYADVQRQFMLNRWHLTAEQVIHTPFMVDSRFFDPALADAPPKQVQICAVGLERRDYTTLLAAVADLPVQVVIAAGSPWSKRSINIDPQAIPANVQIKRFTFRELRQLYADSRFLVMPLEPVQFQVGVTALLEAMSMGKAVICSQIPGQTDVVREGVTGRYVPHSDPVALRGAISALLDNPAEAERMGRAGRAAVVETLNLDTYATRLGRVLTDVLSAAPATADEPLRETV